MAKATIKKKSGSNGSGSQVAKGKAVFLNRKERVRFTTDVSRANYGMKIRLSVEKVISDIKNKKS